MITRLTLTAVFSALAACSHHQPANTILPSDIAKLENLPPVSSSKFDLSLTLKDGGKTLMSKTISGQEGSPVKFSKQRKFVYPSSYDLPKTSGEGEFPVASPTPRELHSLQTGWTMEFVARRSGGLVILEGNVTNTSVDFSRGVFGEGSDSIVTPVDHHLRTIYVTITDNRGEMPIISKTTYPLTIRTIPNKDYFVSLPDGTNLHVKLQTQK